MSKLTGETPHRTLTGSHILLVNCNHCVCASYIARSAQNFLWHLLTSALNITGNTAAMCISVLFYIYNTHCWVMHESKHKNWYKFVLSLIYYGVCFKEIYTVKLPLLHCMERFNISIIKWQRKVL